MLIGFAVVLLMMTTMGVFNYYHETQSENALAELDGAIFPNALAASDMAANLVQIQQFLTDVSASHNLKGYQRPKRTPNHLPKTWQNLSSKLLPVRQG